MTLHRSFWISAVFAGIGAAAAIWMWPDLPARVPSHWGIHGQVNGYMPRLHAALLPGVGVLAFAFLAWLLPAISPNRFRIDPFVGVFHGLMLVIQGFMLVIGISILLNGAGYAMPMPKIAMLGVGALLTIMGNYMGKLQRNFFIGIRTPWTLASRSTWERTHRLAGKSFVVAGLVTLGGTMLGLSRPVAIAVIVVAGVFPALYSYVIYRRVEGPPQD